jgi:hypothetical protein
MQASRIKTKHHRYVNTKRREGDEVVLAYVTLPSVINSEIVQFKQLFGY